jgi:hypothetical protein
MAVTIIWDATTPLGTDNPQGGDDKFRDIQATVVERCTQGGIKWTSGSVLANQLNDGKIAAGVQAVDTLKFYETDLATTMVLWNDNTNIMTMGSGGKLGLWTIQANKIDTTLGDITTLTGGAATFTGTSTLTTLITTTLTATNLTINTGWTAPANIILSSHIVATNVTKPVTLSSAGPVSVPSGSGFVDIATTTFATGVTVGTKVLVLLSFSVENTVATGAYTVKLKKDHDGTAAYATTLFTTGVVHIAAAAEAQPYALTFLDPGTIANSPSPATVGYKAQLDSTSGDCTVTDINLVVVELIR